MHQWWGDNVAYSDQRYTFFKEGQATTAEYYCTARNAATAAGGQGTAAGDAAFEASIANSFAQPVPDPTHRATFWTVAPSNPTSANLFGKSNTYTRPGISYIALRAILGPTNYNAALHHIQHGLRRRLDHRGPAQGGVHEVPAQPEPTGLLDQPGRRSSRSGGTRPIRPAAAGSRASRPITGPGPRPAAASTTPTAAARRVTTCTTTVGGTVPATLSLTLGTAATFGAVHAGRGEGLHRDHDRDRASRPPATRR